MPLLGVFVHREGPATLNSMLSTSVTCRAIPTICTYDTQKISWVSPELELRLSRSLLVMGKITIIKNELTAMNRESLFLSKAYVWPQDTDHEVSPYPNFSLPLEASFPPRFLRVPSKHSGIQWGKKKKRKRKRKPTFWGWRDGLGFKST